MSGAYSVTLKGIDDWSDTEQVARFLALTFEDLSRDDLYAALAAPPVILLAETDEETASFFGRHLRARGAEIEIQEGPLMTAVEEDVPPAPLREIAAVSAPRTSSRPQVPQSLPNSPAAEMDGGEASQAAPDLPPWEQEALEKAKAKGNRKFGSFIKGIWKK